MILICQTIEIYHFRLKTVFQFSYDKVIVRARIIMLLLYPDVLELEKFAVAEMTSTFTQGHQQY